MDSRYSNRCHTSTTIQTNIEYVYTYTGLHIYIYIFTPALRWAHDTATGATPAL